MSVLLLPRLTAIGVSSILDAAGSKEMSPAASRHVLSDRSAMLSFAASGGHRSEEAAIEVGSQLRKIAGGAGFPDNSSQVARSKFDHDAAAYLATSSELDSGEAFRDDVWACLATVIVPDIVAWRFPDRAVHRFEGGVRNTLQRLWMRGRVLDRGESHDDRWGLVRGLSEDAAVQIFERPSIGGNVILAVALAEGWLRMAKRIGRPAMEPVMRRATKLLRLRNEVVDVAGLGGEELELLVEEIFERSRT